MNSVAQKEIWFDDYAREERDIEILEYDITSTPNDFNVTTLYNFIESGAVVIPGFQRHFVWDMKRSSKLIESLFLAFRCRNYFCTRSRETNFL